MTGILVHCLERKFLAFFCKQRYRPDNTGSIEQYFGHKSTWKSLVYIKVNDQASLPVVGIRSECYDNYITLANP